MRSYRVAVMALAVSLFALVAFAAEPKRPKASAGKDADTPAAATDKADKADKADDGSGNAVWWTVLAGLAAGAGVGMLLSGRNRKRHQ